VPTYAYACTACEHRFEVQQAFSDASLTECPECPGRLRKLFNSVGIVFKGSGFYRTDSRSDGKGASGGAEKKSDSTAPATTSASSPGDAGSAGSSGSGNSAGSAGSASGASKASSGSSSSKAASPAA
jgi:putative FmdB family regulatory protein